MCGGGGGGLYVRADCSEVSMYFIMDDINFERGRPTPALFYISET